MREYYTFEDIGKVYDKSRAFVFMPMPGGMGQPFRKRGSRPLNVDNRLRKTSKYKKVTRYYLTNPMPTSRCQIDCYLEGRNRSNGTYDHIAVYDYKRKLPVWVDTLEMPAVWTRIHDSNQTEFFVYSHGKGSKTTMNPHEVFEFFEDFNGDSFNGSFTESRGAGATSSISDSVYECHLTSDSDAHCSIRGSLQVGTEHAIGAKIKTAHWSGSSNQREAIGFNSDSNGLSQFVLCGETNVGQRHRNYNGSTNAYSLQFASGVWTANTYGRVHIFRYLTEGGSCVDNGYTYSSSGSYSTGDMDANVSISSVSAGGNSAQMWVDWIFIRKFPDVTTPWALYPDTFRNKYYNLRRGK